MAAVSQQGKKWTVRYRNRGDRSPRRYTMPVGSTRTEAEKMAIQIQATIDRVGAWSEAPAAARRSAGSLSNLRELVDAFVKHGEETGLAESTLRLKRAALDPFWLFLVQGDRRRTPPPLSALTIDNVEKYLADVARRTTPGTANGYGRQLSALWKWAWKRHADAGVPPPNMPQLKSVPPAQILAPTFDQIDRMVAQFIPRGEATRRLVLIQRWQGLRVSQAGALEVRDFVPDWEGLGPALQVRKGKTARERAEARWVPCAPDLAKRIRSWVEGRSPLELVVGVPPRDPAETVREAWERAGLTPPSQPTHAIRKRFISHLVEQGVADSAIDYLVGHAPKGIRARHYVDPRAYWPTLVRAVATIPDLKKHPRLSSRAKR